MKKSELRQLIREEISKVNINEEKNSWTRDEVITLLHTYRKMAHAVGSQNPLLSISAMQNFIKDNL
jgi:uncharacterized protein YllA (UPF0747 family)